MFQQKIAKEVWENTYKWETDNTPEDTFRRVANFVSKNEKEYKDIYYDILSSFKYIPGGRILSNGGTNLKGTTIMNCYVSGFKGTHQDSIDSIYDELKRQAKILKSEGGYGFCCDVLRPRGAYIGGIGVESPGTVEILKLWDTSSSVITKGSDLKKKDNKGKNKIRKGAMLVSMSCWHPGIEEFITAKQNPGNLTKFNMSVLITDEFINAVINNKPWTLMFPSTSFEKYNDEWDGNIKKWIDKSYPVTIYKEYKNANELWDLIMTSTYNRNEPGVLFIDRINKLNNLYYCEYLSAANPCAEEPLPIDGSCCLGSINLTQYVNNNSFDFNQLLKDIPHIVRFQDAIIDLTNYPLPAQKEKALKTRRVGIGYMGYASMLYMLKMAYGSKEALDFTDMLCSTVTNALYEASANLAKEKGSFKDYNEELYLNSLFIKTALNKKTIDLIKKNGIRNSHLTTIAPTGNSSIFANCVSGGLEPIFHSSYIRTIIESNIPEGLILPTNISWDNQKYDCNHDKWKWVMEGDEWILRKEFNNTIYKIDRNRGLTKEELIFDYSLINNDTENVNVEAFAKTAQDLSIDEHIDTMAIFAKYIDASISKTINCVYNISFEDFKEIYLKAYNTKYIKGFTTYRAGTMTSVLSVAPLNGNGHIIERNAPKRPKSIPCHVHRITVKGDKWIVFVGLYKGHPYEVFAGKVVLVDIPSKIDTGTLTKQTKGIYSFEYEGETIIKDVTKIFENENHEALTRLISTSLRHGVPMEFLAQQLSKSKGTIVDFSKSILRSIKKYIPDDAVVKEKCSSCGGELRFNEGCFVCMSCGMSKCG